MASVQVIASPQMEPLSSLSTFSTSLQQDIRAVSNIHKTSWGKKQKKKGTLCKIILIQNMYCNTKVLVGGLWRHKRLTSLSLSCDHA